MGKLSKIILLSAFFIFISIFNPVYAQNPASNSASLQTDYALTNLINSLSCLISGISINGQGCGTYNKNAEFIRFDYLPSGGAIGALGSGISLMFTHPPVSGIQYTAYLLREELNLAKPVYAQVGGTGIEVVRPIEALWRTSRNIAYLAFTVIFIAVGFMVMFRQRLDAQTVVSVQSALPGLIIGLILVTFSYLIVGLIIDISFVSSQLTGVTIISSLPTKNDVTIEVIKTLNQNHSLDLFGKFIQLQEIATIGNLFGASLDQVFDSGLGKMVKIIIISYLCPELGGLRKICAGNEFAKSVPILGVDFVKAATEFLGTTVGIILPNGPMAILFFLIIIASILVAMFRLFLALIGAYVSIVLYTIFGPFLILFSTIPGRGNLFSQWLLGLISNVLVFPAIFGLFAIIIVILSTNPNASATTLEAWGVDVTELARRTPVGFTQSLPLFANLSQDIIRYILAYGMLLAAPGVPGYIKQLLAKPVGTELEQAATQSASQGGSWAVGLFSRI